MGTEVTPKKASPPITALQTKHEQASELSKSIDLGFQNFRANHVSAPSYTIVAATDTKAGGSDLLVSYACQYHWIF